MDQPLLEQTTSTMPVQPVAKAAEVENTRLVAVDRNANAKQRTNSTFLSPFAVLGSHAQRLRKRTVQD